MKMHGRNRIHLYQSAFLKEILLAFVFYLLSNRDDIR